MKLLIIGDSFSASMSDRSWTNRLGHDTINMSTCGSCEYRIIKKLLESNLNEFDHVLMVHTSPYRIYFDKNPFYQNSETHQECDLIYADIKNKKNNVFVEHVTWWFENVFDLNQAEFLHTLLIEYSQKYLSSVPNTHITFFEKCSVEGVHDFSVIHKQCPGDINHLNEEGNSWVVDRILKILT